MIKKNALAPKPQNFLKYSCGFEARDDYLTGIAFCLNESDNDEQRNCLREARVAQREDYQECRVVFRARKDLCDNIGEAPYDPPFGEDFADSYVDPTEIGKKRYTKPLLSTS